MSFSTKHAVQNWTSCVRPIKKTTGSHMFTIMGYSLDKDIGKGEFLESTNFNVGGYDWRIHYYPNGLQTSKDGEISIFLILESQAEGVKFQVSFTFLDQNGSGLVTGTTDLTTLSVLGDDWGFPSFTTRAELESIIKDDCFIIECVVTIFEVFPVKPTELVVVHPSNILQQLGHLLENGYGADITFEVDGKTFKAHKCILAARSPVFLAQLFGPMKEKSGTVIKIEEMDAPVFKSLLHFIYTGSIPELKDTYESADEDVEFIDQYLLGEDDTYGFERLFCEETIEIVEEQDVGSIMVQHLLAAADRYGMERLKIMCEEILWACINKCNVIRLLSIADRHSCNHLRTACLKFLVTADIVGEVLETQEFQQLVKNDPLILKELLDR